MINEWCFASRKHFCPANFTDKLFCTQMSQIATNIRRMQLLNFQNIKVLKNSGLNQRTSNIISRIVFHVTLRHFLCENDAKNSARVFNQRNEFKCILMFLKRFILFFVYNLENITCHNNKRDDCCIALIEKGIGWSCMIAHSKACVSD